MPGRLCGNVSHRAVTVLLALTAATRGAAAHGPPAAILGVAAADADGPTVVVVSEGLAQRRDGAWRYVCPAVFGAEAAPPAASAGADRTFVSGTSDLFVLERDGDVVPQERPELARAALSRLLHARGAVYAVSFDGADTALRVVEAPGLPLWSGAGSFTSSSADAGGFWLARSTAGRGVALRISLDGTLVAEHAFDVTVGDSVSDVALVEGTLHVAVVGPLSKGALLRVEPGGATTELATSDAPFRGMVEQGRATWTAAKGVLFQVTSAGASAQESELFHTCVGAHGELAYVCARTALNVLGPAGPGGTAVDLRHLLGPDLERVAPQHARACNAQWAVFREDLESVGVLERADGGSPDRATPTRNAEETGVSCSVSRSPRPRVGGWVLPLFLLVLVLRQAHAGAGAAPRSQRR